MLWGLDRDAWISIWSGALGAIPAAVLAALVAMAVLRRSNRKQQELVELQLQMARQEAREVRERAAIADTVSSVLGLPLTSMESREAIHLEVSRLRSALVRWQLELGRGDMSSELDKWEPLLTRAAFNHFDQQEKSDSSAPEKALKILANMAAFLSVAAIDWLEAGKSERTDWLQKSAEQRVIWSEALAEMIGVRVGL